MKKIILGILVLVVGLMTFFSFKGKSSENSNVETNYKILQKWELPEVLDEISGIAWIGEGRVACVQDEDGILFIYNLKTSKVEDSFEFGSGGDYEGIAVIKDDAYVLRSDGVIFKISGFTGSSPEIKRYVTQLSELKGINFEGFCADAANNRLLLAVKERKNFDGSKEVYAFNLNKKVSEKDPLFVVDLNDPIFNKVDGKLKEKFSPGEINIHPKTGEFYILDGSKPKLLITNKDGKPKELIMLRLEDFGNSEGLTFSPNGDLYISNEAEDGPANILKVSLRSKNR